MTVKSINREAEVANWTEAELMYFPFSSRVLENADVDSDLEASIADHFSGLANSDEKIKLAKIARSSGLKLVHLHRTGEELSDSDVAKIVSATDKTLLSGIGSPRLARVADEIFKPAVSLDQVDQVNVDRRLHNPCLPGLFLLYGGPDSGKSHRFSKISDYLNALQNGHDDFSFVAMRMGEPDHRAVGSWREIIATVKFGFTSADEDFKPDVLLIDSLKDLIYMPSKGGAGAGGVSTEVLTILSSLSSSLMREGRTVIAVMNPSQPRIAMDLYESLKSNVTGIFYFNPSRAATESHQSNFSISTDSPMISSVRKWNGTFYDRLSDVGVLSLFGLEGDILGFDGKNGARSLVSGLGSTPAAGMSPQTAKPKTPLGTQAKSVKRGLVNFLNNTTPSRS